jgi:hypothetical protein
MPAATRERTDRKILERRQRDGPLPVDRLLKHAGVIDAMSNFVLERVPHATALRLTHLG